MPIEKKKYKNKYRNESARLPGYDYSSPGYYFITICTHDRENLFGHIQNGLMNLSPIGLIVKEEWEKSSIIRNELFCNEYVIMPNHIHAILRIVVGTSGRTSLRVSQTIENQSTKWQGESFKSCLTPKSISSFVAGFKSGATTRIKKIQQNPGLKVWQSRFHDRVIRNPEEYERIKQYILNNPENNE